MLPADTAWVSGLCEQKAVQSSEREREREEGRGGTVSAHWNSSVRGSRSVVCVASRFMIEGRVKSLFL